MGDITARYGLAALPCIALGVMTLLLCAPAWADPPIDVPGRGIGLMKKMGGSGGGPGDGLGNNGSVINNALTNWQSMPASPPVQIQGPGLIPLGDPRGMGPGPGKAPGNSEGSEEKKGKVRVDVSQTQSLEMMSDNMLMNGSREAMYSQVINRRNVPSGNTLGRSSDGTLKIYGHTNSPAQGDAGVSFEGGQLEVMDDVYQSGLR